MKTIKVAFYKLAPKLNRKGQANFLYKTFPELLYDLATKLDGDTNRQVIDINRNGLETSIWFDYLNEKKYFELDDLYYFLLAKDVSSIMNEDKKNNKLVHKNSMDDDIHLKIPAHFIYFPDKEVLGVEELSDAPSKSIIERAIREHTHEHIKFNPVAREDVLDRLNTFLDAIESVEFDMGDFSYLLKDIDADDFLKFINANKSQMKIQTYLDTHESKKIVFDFFSKLFYKKAESEILEQIENMRVKYKNEDKKEEIISIIENLLVFKKEREIYLEEFQNMEDNMQRRLKYSKSVYQTIMDCYDEYYG